MPTCSVCEKPKSAYLMDNKSVCLRCDELLFDIEIECEEEKKVIPLRETPHPMRKEDTLKKES